LHISFEDKSFMSRIMKGIEEILNTYFEKENTYLPRSQLLNPIHSEIIFLLM